MPFGLTQTVAPTVEPVSLDIAKSHLRVTWATDDAYISAILAGARAQAERESGRQFVTATWELKLDDFPRWAGDADCGPWPYHDAAAAGTAPYCWAAAVRLPVGPVVAVDSVTYRDTDGATQTLATTEYDVAARTGRVVPLVAWPATYASSGAAENVTITFRAGYGGAADVPGDAVAAVLLILADRYQNRGDNVTNFLADRPIPAAALRLLRGLSDGQQW